MRRSKSTGAINNNNNCLEVLEIINKKKSINKAVKDNYSIEKM